MWGYSNMLMLQWYYSELKIIILLIYSYMASIYQANTWIIWRIRDTTSKLWSCLTETPLGSHTLPVQECQLMVGGLIVVGAAVIGRNAAHGRGIGAARCFLIGPESRVSNCRVLPAPAPCEPSDAAPVTAVISRFIPSNNAVSILRGSKSHIDC